MTSTSCRSSTTPTRRHRRRRSHASRPAFRWRPSGTHGCGCRPRCNSPRCVSTHILLASPAVPPAIDRIARDSPPDVVLAVGSGMARFALRRPLDRSALVVDLVDVDSEKWAEMARVARPPMRWVHAREAALLRRFERRVMEQAHATLVVNDRESRLAAARFPAARVEIVPNGVDAERYRPPGPPPPAESAEVLCCGVMNYRPNVDAAVWLATRVWPLVRAAHPEARLTFVGANPTLSVRRLASERLGVAVTGTVDDVRPFLWRAALATAPLSIARGVQVKVPRSRGRGVAHSGHSAGCGRASR